MENELAKIIHDFFPEESNHLTNSGNTFLYHYSNIDAILNILKSKQIWLSHVSQMNDSSEGRLIFEHPSNIQDTNNSYDLLLENFYLCSFSGYGNLLSQWRGYGNINMGFSRDQLESSFKYIEDANGETLETSGVHLTHCDYINVDDSEYTDVVEQIRKQLKDIDKVSRQRELLGIGISCFSMKHSGFKQESESRIIAYLWNRKPFEENNKKYIKFRFEPDAVKRIVVGPAENQKENIEKIQSYLNSDNNYSKVEVFCSGIPYKGL